MQHASPDAYRAEARGYREIADQHERTGRTLLAEQFREMADNCDERANELDTDR
ncbi:hypothetical protein [Streptomyces sp. WM6349]|uniref:hypothetical protein n=1 Tax=Streptomyces sp. WM6349 TaxID=1415552 RepID=UPI000AE01603|nr:hypothetical protein [Streptomyces sp. WM6349]